MRDIVVIVEEGNLPHLHFPRYYIMVLWVALNSCHLDNAQCAKGSDNKFRRLAVEYLQASAEAVFQSYGHPLNNAVVFKYLIHILTPTNDNWPAVVANMMKDRNKWARMSCIIGRDGANERMYGKFFKADVQAVLLFRS